MPRSLIYAMIPIGFILLVLFLMFSGFLTQEVVEEPPVIVEDEDQIGDEGPAP
jgi:TRAP-type C4-dicarboxylate transport system permease small subunit